MTYFIAQTDFIDDNANRPRWRVYSPLARREPWGHQPAIPVSDYYWTAAEALARMHQLEEEDDTGCWAGALAAAGIAILTWLILAAYLIL